MSSERKTLNAFMSSLTDELGGLEASAAIITARFGKPVSKGTLSRKKSGEWDWTVCDVIALQEAAGRKSVFEWLMTLDDDSDADETAMAAAARNAEEFGEAMSALMTARTPADRAKAIKEWRDVVESADRVVDALEAGQ